MLRARHYSKQLAHSQAVQFLREYDLKAVVIACNTASAHALDSLREQHPDLPIIGVIEPAFTTSPKQIAAKAAPVVPQSGPGASLIH